MSVTSKSSKTKIRQIISRQVISVTPETPADEVVSTMAHAKISCIVVIEKKKPVGIFTERDLVKLANQNAAFGDRPISDLMTSPVVTIPGTLNIYEAYSLMLANRIRHHVVVDNAGRMLGLMTQSDLITYMGHEYFFELRTVEQIMSTGVMTVTSDASLSETLAKMAGPGISCVVVADNRIPLGIVTERDAVRLVGEGIDLDAVPAGMVMSNPVVTVTTGTAVYEVAQLMKRDKIRRVVIVNAEGIIAGIITQSDIIKGLEGQYIESLKEIIREKENIFHRTSRELLDKSIFIDNILRSSINMAIVATDRNLKIKYFNPVAENIFGRSSASVIGRSAEALHILEKIAPISMKHAKEVALTEGKCTFNAEIRKDGTVFYYEGCLSDIRDKQDKLAGFVLMLSDTTERRQAELYGELTRNILQILNEPGSLQDSIQRILTELKTRTGVDAVSIRLQNGEDYPYLVQDGLSGKFVHAENTLAVCSALEGLCRDEDGGVLLECTCGLVISGRTDPACPLFTAGGSFQSNDLFKLLDMSPDEDPRLNPRNKCMYEGYASMALVPIRNKERIVGLIQFCDRHKGCFTLHMVELLEGIVSHIGETIMRKQIEEELQKKNSEIEQFFYAISHDLRGPVVTVKTFMGFLEKDMEENNRDRVLEDIQYVHNAADKMKLLLDELLEMTRIGHTETAPVKTSLKKVMTDSLDSLAGVINERNAVINLPERDLELFGDYPRLRQIWQNLIDNAIKYSHHDVSPKIELGVQHVSRETIFFVRDNGVGIDPQYHHKIFGIFEKLNSHSPGAGLGLSMIQRIVEKFGGRVWVESEGLGKGSCFKFTLPLAIDQVSTLA